VGIPERKRPLGRTRHRWEDNIKTSQRNKVGECGLESSGLELVPVVGPCEHCNKYPLSIKGKGFID
jgi:hypothetical protein